MHMPSSAMSGQKGGRSAPKAEQVPAETAAVVLLLAKDGDASAHAIGSACVHSKVLVVGRQLVEALLDLVTRHRTHLARGQLELTREAVDLAPDSDALAWGEGSVARRAVRFAKAALDARVDDVVGEW